MKGQGKVEAQKRYDRWWKGKMCRPARRDKPFKLVREIRLVGPPSFVYGQITLIYRDGSEDVVSGFSRGFKPVKKDVEVQG